VTNLGNPVAAAGAAATGRQLVADQLAAAPGKTGGRLIEHARYYWLRLAESSDVAAVWGYGDPNCGVAQGWRDSQARWHLSQGIDKETGGGIGLFAISRKGARSPVSVSSKGTEPGVAGNVLFSTVELSLGSFRALYPSPTS